jgi:uncharacterized protein YpmB
MIKNVLQSTVGAEAFAIISLVIFVAVFAAMLFFVARASKQYIEKMSQMPLENDEYSAR